MLILMFKKYITTTNKYRERSNSSNWQSSGTLGSWLIVRVIVTNNVSNKMANDGQY